MVNYSDPVVWQDWLRTYNHPLDVRPPKPCIYEGLSGSYLERWLTIHLRGELALRTIVAATPRDLGRLLDLEVSARRLGTTGE